MEFCLSDWYISDISAVVGSTVWFEGELGVGGVVGDSYVDIDETSDRNVEGFFSLSQT